MNNYIDDNIDTSEKVTLVRATPVVLGAIENYNTVKDNLKIAGLIYEDDIESIINMVEEFEENILEW